MRAQDTARELASRTAAAALVAGAGLLAAGPAWAQEAAPGDAEQVRAAVQAIAAHVDAPAYAAAVSREEHVALCYLLVHDRAPTPRELVLMRAFEQDLELPPSATLSFVLRGEEPGPTWAACRALAQRAGPARFRGGAQVRDALVRARATPRAEVLAGMAAEWKRAPGTAAHGGPTHASTVAAYEPYNTYFGYLHAHCGLSDGTGTPLEAYSYARDTGGLDFFALTDHGELLAIWPWEQKWQQLRDAAQATDAPGSFAALWGFEWSHPLLGHINVLNTDDYTGALNTPSLTGIYDWLVARPDGFGRFNHPGRYDDVGTEFEHLAPYPSVAPQMAGISVWNKGDGFERYYYSGGWTSAFSYWDEGNLQGWSLGALGGQDNHEPDWGTKNERRVAVLAEELTREAIVEAYLARRFYSTEDVDLLLDLRARGRPMGSRLTGPVERFELSAKDGSGDGFEEARLYRDGTLVETRAVSGSSVAVVFQGPHPAGSYYYVIVRQTDDEDGDGRNDEAISSPIWLDG